VGYNVVFYLAALQNLPGDVLEAALIDGATPWQRFWKVTFPLLSPMTFFLFVMNTIYAFFDTFPFVDLLTKLAAAQSVVLFFGVVLLTLLQFRLGERRVHYGG